MCTNPPVQASERDFGTASCVTACVLKGAFIVRVHNVEMMSDVVAVANAIHRAS